MRNLFVLVSLFIFLFAPARAQDNHDFYPGNYSGYSVIGNSLPGKWRPFSDHSPWNIPIPDTAAVDGKSASVINFMDRAASNIRFSNTYMPALWIVNSNNMETHLLAHSASPFDIWDPTHERASTVETPINTTMWGEQTSDGHITIIDPFHLMAWEMSRYRGIVDNSINCSTFNIWDLSGKGFGDPDEGWRSGARGGRGSGFPVLAGLIRPEEVQSGEIRHALVFTFGDVRDEEAGFYAPACRSDGSELGSYPPAEGMLFRLNPALSESDFNSMGLSEAAKVVARALQKYGMYLCDSGGDMALQLQLLDKDAGEHRKKWDAMAPGLYGTIINISTSQFELIQAGTVLHRGAQNITTTPLIQPICGEFTDSLTVTITEHRAWPDAEIRYTLDGTEPGESSMLYTGPFSLTSSAVVVARSFDALGGPSHTMRAPFVIGDYKLSLSTTGEGIIETYPDPVKSVYKDGELVTLSVVPEPGWSFSGWSGDLSDTISPVTLAMDVHKTVNANFEIISRVDERRTLDKRLDLKAYPLPFSSELTISFFLVERRNVSITMYSNTGEMIDQEIYERIMPGKHTIIWNMSQLGGSKLPDGMYYIKLNTDHSSQIIKIIKE